MILSGPMRIRLEGPFPGSTLCGNAELGDNNQVQVALDIFTFVARGTDVALCEYRLRQRVQYISLGVRIRDYRLDTD